jgi:hypothetical protein
MEAGTAMLNHSNEPVIDIDGAPVTCVGTWHLPMNIEQFTSAMFNLHKARKQKGPYQHPCAQCVLMDTQGQYFGCRNGHRAAPQLWSSGNPCTDDVVKDWVSSYARPKSGIVRCSC